MPKQIHQDTAIRRSALSEAHRPKIEPKVKKNHPEIFFGARLLCIAA
jgi:hypothetical protein